MSWTYKNKKTGEEIISNCIDSYYWNNEWECINSTNLDYNNVEFATTQRIAQMKEVSLNPPVYADSTYTWSCYDVLSLIKVIEEQRQEIEDLRYEVVAAASQSW